VSSEREKQMSEDINPDEILEAITGGLPVSELADRVKDVLVELLNMNNTIDGVIVSTLEGLPLTWYAKNPEIIREEGRVAAAATVVFSTSERNALDLGKGHIDHVIIRTERGYIILRLAGEDYIVAAVTDINAKLGVVLRDLKWAADKIKEIIEEAK